MKKFIPLPAMVLLAGMLLPGCDELNRQGASGAGFASGIVTNVSGQPVKGAEIIVRDVFSTYRTLRTVSGNKGQYSIALPADPEDSEWTVNAEYKTDYNGKEYTLHLDSDPVMPFSTGTGGVVNFTLKQTGRKEPGGPGIPARFFGGIISCYPGDGADMSKVTITVKPLQPLIDGSQAQVQVLRPELNADLNWVVNVPIGLYEISAREGNTMLYLRDYTRDIPDANVPTLIRPFEPCPVDGAAYWIKMDVLKNR